MIKLLQCWLAIPVAADDSTSKTVLAASGANRYTPGRPPPNSRALRALPASCPQRGMSGCALRYRRRQATLAHSAAGLIALTVADLHKPASQSEPQGLQ